MAGAITCVVEIMSSVWPSGAAFATASAPIVEPAPGRLSTTTGWPSALAKPSDITRATTSVKPPGENGTTSVTGLLGYAVGVCVCADPDDIATTSAAAATRGESILISF